MPPSLALVYTVNVQVARDCSFPRPLSLGVGGGHIKDGGGGATVVMFDSAAILVHVDPLWICQEQVRGFHINLCATCGWLQILPPSPTEFSFIHFHSHHCILCEEMDGLGSDEHPQMPGMSRGWASSDAWHVKRVSILRCLACQEGEHPQMPGMSRGWASSDAWHVKRVSILRCLACQVGEHPQMPGMSRGWASSDAWHVKRVSILRCLACQEGEHPQMPGMSRGWASSDAWHVKRVSTLRCLACQEGASEFAQIQVDMQRGSNYVCPITAVTF